MPRQVEGKCPHCPFLSELHILRGEHRHSANKSGSLFYTYALRSYMHIFKKYLLNCPEGQKLHLHLERLALHERDR